MFESRPIVTWSPFYVQPGTGPARNDPDSPRIRGPAARHSSGRVPAWGKVLFFDGRIPLGAYCARRYRFCHSVMIRSRFSEAQTRSFLIIEAATFSG